jgi:hypothetical protein
LVSQISTNFSNSFFSKYASFNEAVNSFDVGSEKGLRKFIEKILDDKSKRTNPEEILR